MTGPALAPGTGTVCGGVSVRESQAGFLGKNSGKAPGQDGACASGKLPEYRDLGTGCRGRGPDVSRGATHWSQEGFPAGCLFPAQVPFEFSN